MFRYDEKEYDLRKVLETYPNKESKLKLLDDLEFQNEMVDLGYDFDLADIINKLRKEIENE